MTSAKKVISKKDLIFYLISFLLAGIFIYFSFKGIEFSTLLEMLGETNVWYALLFCIGLLMSHLLRAIRWGIMLSSIKKGMSISHLFGSVLIGYGLNNAVPRLGEVGRGVALGELEGVSKTAIFGTVIVERVIDVFFFAGAVLSSALLYEGELYEIPELSWLKSTVYIGVGLFLAAVTVFVLTIRYRERFYGIIVNLIKRISENLAEKTGHLFENLVIGFGSLRGWKNYFSTLILSFFIIANYALNSYIGFYAMNMQDIQPVTLSMGWIVMTISSFGVMIPTPGGIGSYHAITKTVLTALYAFSAPIAMAYATLTHGLAYIMHTIASIFFFVLFRKKFSNFKDKLLQTNKDQHT